MEDEFQLGLSQVSCNYDSLPLHQLDFYLKFKEWLQYSKANFENLEIVQFVQEGRGALAAKDIQIDEDICSIPLELLITKKTAENSKVGRVLLENSIQLPDEFTIIYLFVIYEKFVVQDSFWKPYLDFLPSRTETPLSYPSELLQELKGTNLYEATEELKSKLKRNYDSLFPLLSDKFPEVFPQNIFTWENYLCYYEIIWGRLMTVLLDDNRTAALVPLIDLLNHSSTQKVSYFTDVKESRFCLKTHSFVPKGTQAWNNFGPRPNEKLLLIYGFTLENNFADTLLLKIGASQDPLFPQKIFVLKELQLSLEHHVVKSGEVIPLSLLDSLRICLLNEEEFYFFNYKEYKGGVISQKNEFLMFHTLKNLLEYRKNRFSTTLEQDKELIKTLSPGTSPWFVLVYRIGQKELIQASLIYLEKLQQEYIQTISTLKLFPKEEEYLPLQDGQHSHIIIYEKWLFAHALSPPSFRHMIELKTNKVVLLCSKEVSSRSSILDLSFSFFISQEFLCSNELGKKILNIEGLDEKMQFVLFLMHNRVLSKTQPENFPFFHALPSYQSLPLFFSEKELDLLENTFVALETLDQLQEIQEEFQLLVQILQEREDLVYDSTIHTQENYFLCSYFVDSHRVTIFRKGKYENIVIPMAYLPPLTPDHPKHLVFEYEHQTDILSLKTLTQYQTNERILDRKVTQDCHSLFQNDGIVLSYIQPHDNFPIELELPEENQSSQLKLESLNSQGFGLGLKHFLKLNHFPSKLIASMRILVLSSNVGENEEDTFISNNEQLAIQSCIQLLQSTLDTFSTSIEEDHSLLTKGKKKLNRNKENIVLYRLHQKQILQNAIQELEKMNY